MADTNEQTVELLRRLDTGEPVTIRYPETYHLASLIRWSMEYKREEYRRKSATPPADAALADALEEIAVGLIFSKRMTLRRAADALRARAVAQTAESVRCRFCGGETMHVGDICYGCAHKSSQIAAQPQPAPEGMATSFIGPKRYLPGKCKAPAPEGTEPATNDGPAYVTLSEYSAESMLNTLVKLSNESEKASRVVGPVIADLRIALCRPWKPSPEGMAIDVERLDFLAEQGASICTYPKEGKTLFYLYWVDDESEQFGTFETAREAIDSAMRDAAYFAAAKVKP